MANLYTSDLHLNHSRIIELSHRPFKDLPEMHEALIANWNAKVTSKDVVYVLGDLALGDINLLEPIISRLNGLIVLVKGNHDKSPRRLMEACPTLKVILNNIHLTEYVGDKGYRVFARHFPPSDPLTWEKSHNAHIYLHGHVHESYSRRGNAINVGVDVRGFAPQTFEELIKSPTTPEKPRPDQCRVCGVSLTDVAADGTRTYRECSKHPPQEM